MQIREAIEDAAGGQRAWSREFEIWTSRHQPHNRTVLVVSPSFQQPNAHQPRQHVVNFGGAIFIEFV